MHGAGGMSAGVCAGLCSVFHVCMSLCSVALGMFPIHVHAYIAHVPRGYVCVCEFLDPLERHANLPSVPLA